MRNLKFIYVILLYVKVFMMLSVKLLVLRKNKFDNIKEEKLAVLGIKLIRLVPYLMHFWWNANIRGNHSQYVTMSCPESIIPLNITQSVKYPKAKMFWGCFCIHNMGALAPIDEEFPKIYKNWTEEHTSYSRKYDLINS